MKKVLIVLLLVSGLPVCAQESDQDKELRQNCVSIAAKLYPDVLNRDSLIIAKIVQLQQIMKARNSTILDLPQEPLMVAAAAADVLKIQPKWSALSDEEKETAYYSVVDALAFARDLGPAEAQSAPATNNEIAAFDCYLFELTSVTLGQHGYVSGAAKGYDKDGATAFAKQQWIQMPDDQKQPYEKMAQETGDPIAQQQATQANAPVPVRILQGQGD